MERVVNRKEASTRGGYTEERGGKRVERRHDPRLPAALKIATWQTNIVSD
jgi:hypothetical protein